MHRPRGRRFVPVRPEESNRINRQIRVPEVRLVGVDGEQLGVVETQEALQRAQEAGLDRPRRSRSFLKGWPCFFSFVWYLP